MPLMLDQFLWSERVHWLHLGPPPLTHHGLSAEQVCAALLQATAPPTRLRAAGFGRQLRELQQQQDPGAAAVQLLRQHYYYYHSRASSSSSSVVLLYHQPPPLPPLPAGLCLMSLGGDEGQEEDEEEGGGCGGGGGGELLQVAAVRGSERDVAFLYDEHFPRSSSYLGGPLRLHVCGGDVVVDVGANIGLFCLHLMLHINVDVASSPLTLIAIEPAPLTFQARRQQAAH